MTLPLRILLFASLALNLLIAGAAFGGYAAGLRVQRPSEEPVVAAPAGARAIINALPPETRREVRRDLAQTWSDSEDLRGEAREARVAAYAAAAEEPYDVEKVRAAFARMREADQAALAAFHDRVAQSLGDMGAEERRGALDAIAQERGQRRDQIIEQWRERREERLERREDRRERRRERIDR